MKHITKLLCAAVALALMLASAALAEAPTEDRAGNAIALPAEVNSIVSLAPATTQIIESLGLTDKLAGVDTQSPLYVAGLDELPQFDMMAPDVEQIAALEPDIVFASGISYLDGDPFAALEGMGICVVDIPTSNSIAAVGEDVLFTAQCLGMADEAIGVSPNYLTKRFRACFDMPLHRYVVRTRIERAQRMLLSGSCNITEAAAAAGFSSIHVFSKTFKSVLGMTPSAYMESVAKELAMLRRNGDARLLERRRRAMAQDAQDPQRDRLEGLSAGADPASGRSEPAQ